MAVSVILKALNEEARIGPAIESVLAALEGIGGEPEPGLATRQERIKRSVEHLPRCGYFD